MNKIFANDDDLDIIINCLEIKAYREYLCKEYLFKDEALSKSVIKYFSLEPIQDKYITKEKIYNDNSYNKQKIKKKEIIFIKKLYSLKGLLYIIEKQRTLDSMLQIHSCAKEKEIDEEIYEYIKVSKKIKYNV